MILTRSPFYFNQAHPNNYITSIDFALTVGTGSTSSITSIGNYTFTKANPSSGTTNTYIDISPYIRDYFQYTPMSFTGTTSNEVRASGARSVLVVEATASFNDSLGSTEDDETSTYIATDGYGFYRDGQNHQPDNKILLSHTEYKSDYRGYFIVPLRAESGDSNPTVNSVEVSLSFTDTNTNYVKYLVIPCANYSDTITVSFEGDSITIELVEECKYSVNEIQFINRYGVFEVIHFYKAQKDSISFSSENFKNNRTNGTSYDTDAHQIKRYNVRSNKKFTVETGFLNEGYNQTLEELCLSEHVWSNGVPVNPVKNSLNLKTRIVDKLITYSLDFEYAFDQVNNV